MAASRNDRSRSGGSGGRGRRGGSGGSGSSGRGSAAGGGSSARGSGGGSSARGGSGGGSSRGGGSGAGGRPPARGRAGGRASRPSARTGAARPVFTPTASPFRQKVERRSLLVLAFLRGLPRPVPGLAVLGILAAGLFLPGVAGAIGIAAVALLLGWLIYLSWPVVPLPGRVVRLAVLALVIASGLARLLGRF